MVTLERRILRIRLNDGAHAESIKDEVVVEDQLELFINNTCYAIFSFTPYEIKELIMGHLLTEGIISKLEEMKSLEISEGRVDVYLANKTVTRFSEKPQLILTSCSSKGLKVPPRLWMKAKVKNNLDFRLKPQTILKALTELNSHAFVFRRTGGTHASALLDEEGKLLEFSEDIGRHNAIDKVIGKAALDGIEFTRTLLASTGRLTSEMVIKAASARIPAIVSMAAPTDKGIKMAEITGLTLIGFARGKRFNVYTYPERIVVNKDS